jgi:hypothetical protein
MHTHTVDPYLTSPIRHRILTLGDFGETLLAIKQGLRMRRHGWDPKSYIALQVTDDRPPFIYHKTAEGPIVPWVASQSDLLALDWRTI